MPLRGDAAGPVAAHELAPGVKVTAAVQLLRFRSGAPDLVRARTRVASRGGALAFAGGTGFCARTVLTIRAYAEGARPHRAAAVWTSDLLFPDRRRRDRRDRRSDLRDTVVVCVPYLMDDSLLLPGDTAEFHATVPIRQILGDSLPAGRYRFTVVLHPDNVPGRSTPELAAGSLVLRR